MRSSGVNNYEFDVDAPEKFAEKIRTSTFVGRWQTRSDYEPVQFDGLVARLKDEALALAYAEGYFDASVTVASEKGKVSATLELGKRTKVAELKIELTGPVSDHPDLVAKARDTWPLPVGDGYSAPQWNAGKRGLLLYLSRQGYLRAQIADSQLQVSRKNKAAYLSVRVDSGPRLNFGNIKVDGLERYERDLVNNLRTFKTGEPFEQKALLDFQARVRNSGYFEEVGVLPDMAELKNNPNQDQVTILVTVLERKSKRAGFGVGYSTDEGIRGQVGLEHRDLFSRNWQLESAIVLSTQRQRIFANVRTPFDDRNYFWGFGARLEREDIQGQLSTRSNAYFGRGRRVGDTESFLSIQDQNESTRYAPAAGTPATTDGRRALVLGYTWSRRRLDSVVSPRNGYTLSAQLSGAHADVLSDASFVRSYLRVLRYLSFSKESALREGTFVLIGELGHVAADSRAGIPSENLFRTGGGQSVRGYGYLSLGVPEGNAITGGRYLGVLSAEFQYRITDLYSLAAFFDYGNATDNLDDFTAVAGYGLGVRFRSPIGPINLDLAYGEAVRKWRLHFSVGYSF